MNVCRYIASRCNNLNTRCLQTLYQPQSGIPRLPVHIRSWQRSSISRHLHIKKDSKKTFGNHKMDKVPPEFSVVYQSSIGPWFLMFRVGMTTVCGCLGFVYYMLLPEMSQDFFLSQRGIFLIGSTSLFIIFVSVFGYSARQFFTRIYHHSDTGRFVGVRRTLFARLKQLSYLPEDIQPILSSSKKSTDGWESINVKIKGQTVHLQSKDFLSPSFYNVHFGANSYALDHMVREPKF